jgi:16S rRNA U1498 N3-methylase RsmE
MADALLARDKKTLWILLQEAHMKEVASEEIIGVLWWQLKTLRLTYVTSTASEAGVKDFPYNKAKRAHSKFTQTDADRLSRTLLAVYHDSHSGRRDMTSALEEWVLKI